MSVHEVEWLSEQTIGTLDRVEDVDHRSLFKAVYEFDSMFDTKFTRFRVMDILLKRRFCYHVALEEHPQYPQFQEKLESIREEEFAHIYRDPLRKWHGTENPMVCYWSAPHLYFEAGSEVWKSFAQRGRLVGPDAVEPAMLDAVDVASALIDPALTGDDAGLELLSSWYVVMPIAITWPKPVRRLIATASDDPMLQRIRDAVFNSKAYSTRGIWTPGQAVASLEGYRRGSGFSQEETQFLEWWFPPSLVDATPWD